MHKKRLHKKYKDLLHLAIILAILMFYAYYENNKKVHTQFIQVAPEVIIASPKR